MSELLLGIQNEKVYVEDAFSAVTYTGTGAAQSVTTGVNLSTSKGMQFFKRRDAASYPTFYDECWGSKYIRLTCSSGGDGAAVSQQYDLGGWSTTGVNLSGGDSTNNAAGGSYIVHTFKNAPKFFQAYSGTVSVNSDSTVSFPDIGTIGMVVVQGGYGNGGPFYVWHRSQGNGTTLYMNNTNAATTSGSVTVSGTDVTLHAANFSGGGVFVYAFAHDTSVDGLIQCGSFTTDPTGVGTVTLGWEPQYILYKSTSTGNWVVSDTAREMSQTQVRNLIPNTSAAEYIPSGYPEYPTATGFSISTGTGSQAFVYMAIRKGPMRTPTTGTQVYNAVARTGTGSAATVTGVGFAPDLVISTDRQSGVISAVANYKTFVDRLRGSLPILHSDAVSAESSTATDAVQSFGMDGITVGSGTSNGTFNYNGEPYINHFFKRAPGFMDVVCYKGTGSGYMTLNHNLSVAPELYIVKARSAASDWFAAFYIPSGGNLALNSTSAANSGLYGLLYDGGSSTVINLASQITSGVTYVAYLFATCPGVSKVFSYTGNGTSQTIPCGFTTGARFVLVKRTDAAGDWYCWDSVRGIVAGTDPHISLNTAVAEVTTDSSIDPAASGFIAVQNTTTNINVTSSTYIGLAIS